MPPEKPEYRIYRARRGIFGRFLNRRERERFERSAGQAQPDAPAGRVGTLAPEAPPGAPPAAPPPKRPRRPVTWKRVLVWVLGFMAGWTLLSLALFMISAHEQKGEISDGTKAALDDGGNMLTAPNNILVLGSDRRPGEERGRADTIMLMRYGGGKAARLSIPRDTIANIPGTGPTKINAAYAIGGPALMIETVKQHLGIEVNHIVEIDFNGFPKFVDALGGVNMTFGKCIVSRFEGRTVRFGKGEHHLDGQDALDVVRVRKNACDPSQSDLTRARRQQQFLEAVKGRILNPLTFPRWPWAAWRAPQAVRSDLGGLGLMALYFDMETAGKLKPRILPLDASDAQKQAEVQRFVEG